MTTFEFVFALYSIIASLALTHMLTGLVSIARGRSRVRYSITHALWVWTGFAIVIGNWQSQWVLRELQVWPSWSVFLLIATVIFQFVFCAFVTPEASADEDVDLVKFHEQEHRRYIGAFVSFTLVAFAYNIAFGISGAYLPWLRDNAITISAALLSLIALFHSGRRLQMAVAAMISGMATYFLVVASSIAH